MKKIIILASLLFFTQTHLVQADATTELCLEGDTCTFVLLSEMNGRSQQSELTVINDKRAKEQLSPFSTFKIPNSLIGLELSVIKDTEQTLTFNKTTYPPQAWWPSVWKLPQYNLRSAFKYSMVAVFRQLASDIGEANLQSYVKKFAYGNQDISSQLDDFWLNGSLKISAMEQVQFLQRLYHNQLDLRSETFDSLKSIMLIKANKHTKIYAKTGAGKVTDGSMLGWYVGFVENTQGVHFFAFNFNRDTYAEMKAVRVKIAMNHLKKLGIVQ
ncbi:class D beta-lactamase [Colwellia hornerae]|uniref:Beta-lactamase n=1 Tax=Colwellia hornerae TaxID=89402 RepID=A0A5C6Q514_9GAMM|nr:class D beta-lactamase [Colwellia hornerae]TWX48116.1 class D beta-lactamase [Colwellia hornerae]TWX55117.1 class D beta-lactamase [Colwellia hornerae]TWX64013.1 class D beta-lactamase [Colwellia hornerae]